MHLTVLWIRSTFCVLTTVMYLGFVPALSAQEVIFRYDGQTNREGKSVLSIPVTQGQQLLFRVASLDFQPSLGLSFNGAGLQTSAPGTVYSERFARIQKAGTVSVNITANSTSGGANGGSFQFRVLKFKENPALTRSGVIRGSISQNDPIDQDGKRIDWYPLPVTKGQKILIGMASKDTDSHLFVEMQDGKILENSSLLEKSARIDVEANETTTWWVGASVQPRGTTNTAAPGSAYSLWVRDLPPSPKTLVEGTAGVNSSLVPVASDAPPIPENYQFLAPRSGIYTFALNPLESMPVQLRMRTGMDAEIISRPLNKRVGRAEQSVYLRQGQTVNLVVEGFSTPGRTTYQLSAISSGAALPLSEPSTSNYELKPGSNGYFTYRGKPGEYVEFTMGSDNFRTRLKARDEAGQVLSWANYFGSDYSYASLGGYYFEQASELVLETGGFNADDTGNYSLSLRSSLSGKLDIPQLISEKTSLSDDKPLFGRLNKLASIFAGTYGTEYAIDMKPNELISVSLKSRDFDCRLSLLDSDGQILVSNDDFEGSDSLVEYIATKAGHYRVRAMSNITEGKPINVCYSLQLRRNGTVTSLEADNTGTIGEDNPRSDDGRPFAELSRQFRAGQHIYIVLTSADFETRLQLLDSDGLVVDENRGYGQGKATRLELVVQKAGTYQLRISARGGNNKSITGSWTLFSGEIR